MKALYRHNTIFAHQDSMPHRASKNLARATSRLVTQLPKEVFQAFMDSRGTSVWAYRDYLFYELNHEDFSTEPIEDCAIRYAHAIRFFRLPWTLAISRSEAECCFIDIDILSRYILDHFQLKIKITP